MSDRSALISFTPKGRSDYTILKKRRKELIKTFFAYKLLFSMDLWFQGLRALFGTPQTKLENLPRRIIYISLLIFRYKFIKKRKNS